MAWETIERPGYMGKKRDEIISQYVAKYGANFRISWIWNNSIVDFSFACSIYEDAYYKDSFNREDVWNELLNEAKSVFDMDKSDIDSGLDYNIQTGKATHLQDISVRRVIERRGWHFSGDKPVQIRSHKSYWGTFFSPGKVAFHLQDLIESPHIKGWWDKGSIEDFYQSNKVVQIRKPGNLDEMVSEMAVLKKNYDSIDRKYKPLEKAAENEITSIFGILLPEINAQLKGKAPLITKFFVDFPRIELDLDCGYEYLESDEGDLIENTVRSELKARGLEWISVHIPSGYYGK
jgi:hypothetical protein